MTTKTKKQNNKARCLVSYDSRSGELAIITSKRKFDIESLQGRLWDSDEFCKHGVWDEKCRVGERAAMCFYHNKQSQYNNRDKSLEYSYLFCKSIYDRNDFSDEDDKSGYVVEGFTFAEALAIFYKLEKKIAGNGGGDAFATFTN